MADIRELSIRKDSKNAKELLQEVVKMAEEGKVAAIGLYVVMDNREGYCDWCADHPVNIDILAGGLLRVIKNIHEADE